MEKELESDSEKLDVPQFLFIGGTAGSGKSNLLQILQKMLGLSKSKSKPILYNNIILTGRTKKADTITQIQLSDCKCFKSFYFKFRFYVF